MRVSILGAYDPLYARHAIITAGLEANGVEVFHYDIPKHVSSTQRVRHLFANFPKAAQMDVVLVPCFNQTTVLFVWTLARIYRVPLIVDYLVGLTDMNEDRQRASAAKMWLYRQLDRMNTKLCVTLTDTAAHRYEFERILSQKLPEMYVLPVGSREFELLPPPPQSPLVQYAGTYIPFHGVDTILRAAHLLPDVQFELIGKGQTYAENRDLATRLQLQNVRFVEGYFPVKQLLEMQTQSTIMLGVFGASAKTDYVVPNKVYEALALGRPMITAESAAIREFLTPNQHLLTVSPADADALATAIQTLIDNPQQQAELVAAGRHCIEESFFPSPIGVQLLELLETLVSSNR
jgi:glycosyltransferase involved in cell wall biosynthesis